MIIGIRGHGFESRWSPDFFQGFFFPIAAMIILNFQMIIVSEIVFERLHL